MAAASGTRLMQHHAVIVCASCLLIVRWLGRQVAVVVAQEDYGSAAFLRVHSLHMMLHSAHAAIQSKAWVMATTP